MSSMSTVAPIPKRAHKKSRRGCHTCKRRKVKCDERQPLCSPCERRFTDIEGCDFDTAGRYQFKKKDPTEGNNRNNSVAPRRRRHPLSPESGLIVRPTGIASANAGTRSLELKLFYHFTTCTAKTLPLSETSHVLPLWVVDTPQLAFDHENLLNIVLGAAAIHMYTLNPEDGAMLQNAQHYFVQAVQKHREQVSHVNAQNAEAAVVASMLLSTMVRLLPRHSQPRSANDPYTLPVERFYMTKGMRGLLYASFPFLQGSKVLDCIYSWPPNPSNPHDPFLDRRLIEFPGSLKKTPELMVPPDLKGLTMDDESATVDPNIGAITLPLHSIEKPDANHRTYSLVTAYLLTVYRAVKSKEPTHWIRRRLEAMIVFTPAVEFLGLLLKHDPRALGLLARYFALMKVVEGVWWLDGVGEWEARGVMSHMPKEWEWLNEWPTRVLETGLIPLQSGC